MDDEKYVLPPEIYELAKGLNDLYEVIIYHGKKG